MHVVQLTSSRLDAYGGIQSFVKSLTSGLDSVGVSVSEMMIPSLDPNHLPEPGDIGHRFSLLHFEEELLHLLGSLSDVIVNSHNLHLAFKFGTADTVMRCISIAKVPHVCTVHDVGKTSELSKKCLLGSTCVTTSKYNQQRLLEEFNLLDVEVIPPPFDFDALFPTCGAQPRCIAYPGRLVPSKGAHLAIPLLGYLSEDIGHIRLVLSERGRRCYGESQQYIDKLIDIASRFSKLDVSFYRNEGNNFSDFYSAAELSLAVPISPEGFNLCMLESLLCERPSVAALKGGMGWMRNTQGCIAVKESDIPALAKGVSEIFANPSQWRTAAAESKNKLKATYDRRIIASEYKELY